jgi:hypothetical protein
MDSFQKELDTRMLRNGWKSLEFSFLSRAADDLAPFDFKFSKSFPLKKEPKLKMIPNYSCLLMILWTLSWHIAASSPTTNSTEATKDLISSLYRSSLPVFEAVKMNHTLTLFHIKALSSIEIGLSNKMLCESKEKKQELIRDLQDQFVDSWNASLILNKRSLFKRYA